MSNTAVELIKINAETKAVSARELYAFLANKTEFRHWIDRMFEYGFVENVDYTPFFFDHPQNKQQTLDYALSLDCAKEIAMIQRTDKGKQARLYFLECEKALKELVKPKLPTTKELAIMLIASEEEKERLSIQIEAQTVKIAELKPKAEYTDAVLDSASTWTTTLIANELGMSAQKLHRELCVLKFIYEHERTYVLYAKYKGEGYDATRTHITHGGTHTNIYLVWTEKGRNYIHSIVANRNKVEKNNQTEMPLRMAQ